MRVTRCLLVILLCSTILFQQTTWAQDDLDLESLLDELIDEPIEEEVEEPEPSPIRDAVSDTADTPIEEPIAEEPVQAEQTQPIEENQPQENIPETTDIEDITEPEEADIFDDIEEEQDNQIFEIPADENELDEILELATEDDPAEPEEMSLFDDIEEELEDQTLGIPEEETEQVDIPEEAQDIDEDALLLELGIDTAEEDEIIAYEPEEDVPYEEDDILLELGLETEPEEEIIPLVEPEPTSKKFIDPNSAEALAAKEEVRRQADELSGLKALGKGYDLLNQKKYSAALEEFGIARSKIPVRPANENDRQDATWGYTEALLGMSEKIYNQEGGNLDDALKYVTQAQQISPNHKGINKLQQKIAKRRARLTKIENMPIPVAKRKQVKERYKTVGQYLAEARQYYYIEDYDAAERLYEKALLVDEYNVEAMNYLKKIEERRLGTSDHELLSTRAKALAKVRETWTPPIARSVDVPGEDSLTTTTEEEEASDKLREKMKKIIIPRIEFRNANIQDVMSFLVDASVASDKEEQRGVNIILKLDNISGGGLVPSSPQDEFADEDLWGSDFEEDTSVESPASESINSGIPTITLNLRQISLMEALKIITEVANLRYRIDGNVIIVTQTNVAPGPIVTRLYPVQPTLLDVVFERSQEEQSRDDFIEIDSSTKAVKSDIKDFFEKAGVPFPVGTSIAYNSAVSQLIVANTAENLEIFENILKQIDVIPHQVEIEARFVEIGQDDLEELGLQWILTDNYEFLQKKGNTPAGGRERVQVDADTKGITKGLRFFGFDQTTGDVEPGSATSRGLNQTLGNILSVSSILTNPELKVVLHALSQKGGSDLLSAPRVTTRSGVNAQIEVVKEIIYPTEFDVTEPTVNDGGTVITPPTVTPGSFETRETGVILNVTPTVGPDGYTIDLVMIPEVSELIGWIQYGSSSSSQDGTVYTYNIPQPIFSSRNVTTSIVIWDGQTVVMGGLMREQLTTIDDKVPLLGDLPIVGRLFRNKGEYSQKKNLLIFVTARLVDPAGKPIHDFEILPGEGTTAAGPIPSVVP